MKIFVKMKKKFTQKKETNEGKRLRIKTDQSIIENEEMINEKGRKEGEGGKKGRKERREGVRKGRVGRKD